MDAVRACSCSAFSPNYRWLQPLTVHRIVCGGVFSLVIVEQLNVTHANGILIGGFQSRNQYTVH